MKIRKYTYLLFTLLTATGCSDFLKEYSQDNDYVRSWKDLNEVLLGDCYMPVKMTFGITSTTDYDLFIHFLADEVEESMSGTSSYGIAYDQKELLFGNYTWQQRSGQNDTYTGYLTENDSWTEKYKLINVANNIINTVGDLPHGTQEEIKGAHKVEGEARFLRAYYYFWLVNIYGDAYCEANINRPGVPIKLSENVEDIYFTRNTVGEVYSLILSDLKRAEECLQDIKPAETIYRANIISVEFLLSRVYLYMQNWELALEYADKVITRKPDLVNMRNEMEGFLSKDSEETIFSMGGNMLPATFQYYLKGFKVSDQLYDSYEESDFRKSSFFWCKNDFKGYTKVRPRGTYDKDDLYYYYEVFNSAFMYQKCEVSDKFLFRTAEAYLIKAEAQACLDRDVAACNTLNILRKKRYETGSDYTVNESGEALMYIIREERRKELALEGHRWFDLRRYRVCQKYPYSTELKRYYYIYSDRSSTDVVECRLFTLEKDDKAYTLNIPQEVLDYNYEMENNERPFRTYQTVDF